MTPVLSSIWYMSILLLYQSSVVAAAATYLLPCFRFAFSLWHWLQYTLGWFTETIFLEYQPSIVAAAATICSLEEVTALKAADLHGVFADLSVDMVRIITACHLLQRQSLVQFLVFWIAESWSRVWHWTNIIQDAFKKCYEDMQEHLLDSHGQQQQPSKRKGFWCSFEPLSPVGVLEAAAALSSKNGSESTMGSSRESSPGVSLATPTNAHKRRKLDDFACSMTWL
jgi:hypothetical protein